MANVKVAVFCLLVSSVVSKHPSTTLDVDCGDPDSKKPATLTYKGDAVAVYGYGLNDTCRFQDDILTGGYIIKVSYDQNDKCTFKKYSQTLQTYSIKVESRMMHEMFEGGDDERFFVECTFMPYKTNITVDVELRERYKPADYMFFQHGKVALSDFEIYLMGIGQQKITGPVLESAYVSLYTQMTPKGNETAYMPLECLVASEDGKIKVQVMNEGCGTGFPWKKNEGFIMNKTRGESPRFRMFRISKKQGVVFKCSFVICKGECDGNTCLAANQPSTTGTTIPTTPRPTTASSPTRRRRSIEGLAYDSLGLLSDETKGIQRASVGVEISEDTFNENSQSSQPRYLKKTPIYITVLSISGIILIATVVVMTYFRLRSKPMVEI